MADRTNGWERWRVITPVLVTVAVAILIFIASQITALAEQNRAFNEKLFEHMTNAEIHVPREYNVSQSEFNVYKMSSRELLHDIKTEISKIGNAD